MHHVYVCVSWCHSHYVDWTKCVCESVYMYHVYVCVSWCHSHYVGWTQCVCESVYTYHVYVCVSWFVSLCTHIMCMFVYHGL